MSLTIIPPPGPPEICYTPESFDFTADEGEANPPDQSLWIGNCGEGTLDWTVSDDADWLTLSPTSGSSTGEMGEVTLSVDITGMSAGSYSCTITIEDPEATNSPQTASVSLTIEALPGPPPPTGGGGGGAPPPPGPELEVDMMGRVASGPVTEEGELEDTIEVTSRDSVVTLRLREGTVVLDSEDNRLEKITVDEVLEPPALPDKWYVIGMAYDFGPDGVTFDPSIDLIIKYNLEDIPEGVNEGDLAIGYYHSESGQWRLLAPGVVDTGAHTVTSPIIHLTTFAIIGREEASFDIVNLSITPSKIDAGESVTISVEVTNSGGMEDSCTITLWIDGVEEQTKELSLDSGESDIVYFTVTKDEAGTYEVTLDGQSGSFTVTEEEFPWWAVWLGVGLGALLLAAGTAYLLIWRRRRTA